MEEVDGSAMCQNRWFIFLLCKDNDLSYFNCVWMSGVCSLGRNICFLLWMEKEWFGCFIGFIGVKIPVAEIWRQEVRFCTCALLPRVFVIVFALALLCDFPLLASALRFQMFHWKIPDPALDYQTNDLLNWPSLAAANLRYPKAISLFVCINRLWHRSDLFDGKLMDSKNSKSMRDMWLVNTHFKPADLVMLWKHNGILHTMSCINNKKVGGGEKKKRLEIIKLPDLQISAASRRSLHSAVYLCWHRARLTYLKIAKSPGRGRRFKPCTPASSLSLGMGAGEPGVI